MIKKKTFSYAEMQRLLNKRTEDVADVILMSITSTGLTRGLKKIIKGVVLDYFKRKQ